MKKEELLILERKDLIHGAIDKKMVDIERVKRLIELDKVCKLSDDLVLSYSFAKHKIKRKVIFTKYFSGNDDVFPFDYGLGEGALHKGSGTSYTNVADANMVKYDKLIG